MKTEKEVAAILSSYEEILKSQIEETRMGTHDASLAYYTNEQLFSMVNLLKHILNGN